MIRMKNLKLWQIDALGLAVCAAFALLWYAVGLQPLAQAKAQRLSMIDDAAEREKKATQAEASQHSAQQDLAKLSAQVKAGAVQLEPVAKFSAREADVQLLAGAFRLIIDEIKPAATIPTPRFTTVAFTMTGSGSTVDCALFLHELRSKFPDVGVTSFDLKGQPENTERPGTFTFDLIWYAAPASQPDQPAAK